MRLLLTYIIALLLLVLGVTTSPSIAQDQQTEDRPKPQEKPKTEGKAPPAPQGEARPGERPATPQVEQPARPAGQEAKPPQHTGQGRPPEREPMAKPQAPAEQAQPAPQGQRSQQATRGPAQSSSQPQAQQAEWQQHRAQHWQSDHRTWQQRGGYHGQRVPEDRYRAEFGQQHEFRLSSEQVVFVGGYPRFQYGGYWVMLVDPWPEYWAVNWYDTDECYIVFLNDGYYLFDTRYPGVGIAVNIVT